MQRKNAKGRREKKRGGDKMGSGMGDEEGMIEWGLGEMKRKGGGDQM